MLKKAPENQQAGAISDYYEKPIGLIAYPDSDGAVIEWGQMVLVFHETDVGHSPTLASFQE